MRIDLLVQIPSSKGCAMGREVHAPKVPLNKYAQGLLAKVLSFWLVTRLRYANTSRLAGVTIVRMTLIRTSMTTIAMVVFRESRKSEHPMW